MKNPWKKNHLFFLVIGCCCILYWAGLQSAYGTITFSFMFLLGGSCLVLYAFIAHHMRLVLQKALPCWLYRFWICLMVFGMGVFAFVEGRIIMDGARFQSEQGDVILVLGAGLLHGDQISESLLHRLEVARQEHEKSPDTPIIVSGGQGKDETVSEAFAMKQWLVEHGVDASMVWMEDTSRNTNENFQYSIALMQEHGLTSHRISLITNDFHMHRAKVLASQKGLEVYTKPANGLAGAELCFYTREFFGVIRAYLLGY